MSDESAVEPFTTDAEFFPEEKPEGYPAYHNYKRDREAARLKAMGWTLEDIADHFQFDDPRRAGAMVRRGLAMVHQFTLDEKRTEQLQTLELLKKHLFEQMDREHVMVQQGRVILVDGLPMEDRRFVLETIDRIVKIEAQQMDLLGTKAAQRFSVEADQIGGEITSLIALINQSAGTDEPTALPGPAAGELEA